MSVEKYSNLLQELKEIPQVEGVVPTSILELPASVGLLLRTLMRQGSMTVHELAAFFEVTDEQANEVGELLVAKGYLMYDANNADEGQVYRVFFARMRKRDIPSFLS